MLEFKIPDASCALRHEMYAQYIEQSVNKQKFYQVQIYTTLAGTFLVDVLYGRIGQNGTRSRGKCSAHPSLMAAKQAAREVMEEKTGPKARDRYKLTREQDYFYPLPPAPTPDVSGISVPAFGRGRFG